MKPDLGKIAAGPKREPVEIDVEEEGPESSDEMSEEDAAGDELADILGVKDKGAFKDALRAYVEICASKSKE